MKTTEIIKKVEEQKARSAWAKGVKLYAYELLEIAMENKHTELSMDNYKNILLNGATDWGQYSWGGSSLCYDFDICERLCNPTEKKITREGERRPNSREEWLDVQARALYQASCLIRSIIRTNARGL